MSGKISNGQIIHNVDCDMYSNDSQSVRNALCFFMDEEKGQEVAFVQFSEGFKNVTKNEIYSSSFRVSIEVSIYSRISNYDTSCFVSCFLKILILLVLKVEFHGMDGNGGTPYIGSCCFHRRDTLCGRKFDKECTSKWYKENDPESEESLHELEAKSKVLASCTYEENTQWGKEVSLFLNFT